MQHDQVRSFDFSTKEHFRSELENTLIRGNFDESVYFDVEKCEGREIKNNVFIF